MNDLFRKDNLEMANYFPATFAPALDGWKRRVFEQFAAFVDRIVE